MVCSSAFVHCVLLLVVSLLTRAELVRGVQGAQLINGELSRRHDAVADAVGRVAWQVGAQVRREVAGLDLGSKQRPDLEIVFPGRVLLTGRGGLALTNP